MLTHLKILSDAEELYLIHIKVIPQLRSGLGYIDLSSTKLGYTDIFRVFWGGIRKDVGSKQFLYIKELKPLSLPMCFFLENSEEVIFSSLWKESDRIFLHELLA